MKRAHQILVTLASLLCIATLIFCLRSYWKDDSAFWGGSHTAIRFESADGRLAFSYTRTQDSLPGEGWSFQSVNYEPNLYRLTWMSTPLKVSRESFTWLDGWAKNLTVNVAHWLIALLLISPLAGVWLDRTLHRCRRRRRARAGRCPTCGYDLRASAARCPECGATITQAKEAKAGVPAAELLPSEE